MRTLPSAPLIPGRGGDNWGVRPAHQGIPQRTGPPDDPDQVGGGSNHLSHPESQWRCSGAIGLRHGHRTPARVWPD